MQSRGNNKKIQMSKYMVYIVLAVVFVFFAITLRDNGFASTQNLLNILRQTAMISIMSVAGVFVLSAGQIDLTVGSNTAMSAMLVALVLKSTNNIFLALIVALIFGVAVGVINGLLVTRLGLPAFLATLGMMQVIRGAAMWITNTEAVPISNTVFNTIFGTGFVGPISVLILWTILFYILGYILFNRTPFGKHTLATGGNQMAAQYSGIKVQRIKMYVFMLSGALSAFAGVLYAGRMQSGRYSFGDGDEMSVIASVVLGGASMAGGSGSMIGALAGSILMGMISNALILANLSSAQQKMPMFFWPAPIIPVKKMIVDMNEAIAREAKDKFAFESYSTDWHDVVNNPEIDVVDICTPNNVHAEIAIAAAKAGKHIICEKPLALTVDQAREMYLTAKENNIKTLVAFNYRKTPAVQLAKKYIEEGAIGEILDFRGTYLQDWSADPESPLSWRFQKNICGSGALGDIGTHVVDMLRFLVGDFKKVNARTATYIPERPVQSGLTDSLGNARLNKDTPRKAVDVDDQCMFMIECENGAFGSIEATRNAWGRNNYITFEIHGTLGSLYFNYERRDELQVCFASDPDDRRGFRTIYTGPNHPYGNGLWPIPALGIGYTETKIVECYDFFNAIANDTQASPNFEDGYEIELISDAILKSAQTHTWVDVH